MHDEYADLDTVKWWVEVMPDGRERTVFEDGSSCIGWQPRGGIRVTA